MPPPTDRRGFTLLELLVVLAILGVLLGLLLAGVQKARGAVARARCLNNLRQIGLALHQYHGTSGHLPPAVVRPPLLGGPTDPGSFPLLNWQARLLPYLEQEPLWRLTEQAFAVDPTAHRTPPHIGKTTPMLSFVCPADGRAVALPVGWATTSYLGVSGTNAVKQDGVLYRDSSVRLTDVTDGTSNTLMVGERPPLVTLGWGRWYGGWGRWGVADAYLGVQETQLPASLDCEQAPYAFAADQREAPCSAFHYWSLHPGGANFLFADGAARFVRYSAAGLLPALATRAGGEVVGPPD